MTGAACDNCGLEMDDIPESWNWPCPVCQQGIVQPPKEEKL